MTALATAPQTVPAGPHLLHLRDYQDEAIKALHKEWQGGYVRVADVLPTGAGKTVVFSHLTAQHLEVNTGERVLILVHTEELVKQAYNKLKQVAPHLRVGIVKGARNEVNAQVVVASVQSLRAEKRRMQLRRVGLIIVDECHHATAPTYRAILTHFGAFEPDARVRVAGFTATLVRGDSQALGDIWQKVAYRRDILFMIKRGYLLDVRGKQVVVPDLDLQHVRKSGGDYQDKALGDALTDSLAPGKVAEAYLEHAGDRSGIMFCPNVASAYVMAEAMVAAGITCEVVHGGLEATVRRSILARLESGETQVVCNCMVLTEGFDSPRVSCVVIARPTKSAGLYQQMVGRGLRPDLRPEALARDEQDCLVLDVVGASEGNDLRSLVDLTTSELKIKEGQSLLDAEEEMLAELELEEELPQADAPYYYEGPVEVREFDPLARESRWVWLTTTEGTRFLSAGTEMYVFMVHGAEPDTWDVAWCTKSAYDRRGGFTEHVGLELGYAMEWAESTVDELGGPDARTLAGKGKSWRKDPPKPGALAFARQRRVQVPVNELGECLWNAGELSEAIDSMLASQRIDPIVKAIKAQRGQ